MKEVGIKTSSRPFGDNRAIIVDEWETMDSEDLIDGDVRSSKRMVLCTTTDAKMLIREPSKCDSVDHVEVLREFESSDGDICLVIKRKSLGHFMDIFHKENEIVRLEVG